ncbi:MAG: hypothetical protein PHD73_12810, partial [Sediminibacterium sp.]|nr:hypothetical protein [Sediminibacterium sp.]
KHTTEMVQEVINRVSFQYHKSINIPVVLAEVYDKSASIHDYFRSEKVTVLPHYVWINTKGRLTAITSSKEITRENIDYFIKHDTISLPIKDDYKIMFPNGSK